MAEIYSSLSSPNPDPSLPFTNTILGNNIRGLRSVLHPYQMESVIALVTKESASPQDYPNPLYSKLGLEAMKIWEKPNNLFHGLFRRTGWIMSAHEMTAGFLQTAYETSKKAGRKGVKFIDIPETKRMFPQFTGNFSGWTNLWSPQAGWV